MITKKVKYFLVFIMGLVVFNPVLADTSDNIVDFSKKGSISITLSDEVGDIKVSGADITIYKVADAYSKDSNLAFDYHDSLKDYEADLEDGNITDEMLEVITKNDMSNFGGTTNELGLVVFNDLDLGLYLVVQTNQVEGYSKIEPFLVFIPDVIDNKWVYDIDAEPKVDIIRLFDLTVEKVWNVSTNVTTPKEVIIELLKDGEVIDTVTLNEENNWSYTWEQIEMSDKYLVKEKEVPSGYTVTYSQDGNKFVVTNTKSLVQTGSSAWTTPILATIGLLFVVVGIILEKRK